MAIHTGPDLQTEIWAEEQYFLVLQVCVSSHIELQSHCFSLVLLAFKST